VDSQAPRILLTGGTGFIGRAIASALRAAYGEAAVSAPPRAGRDGLELLDPTAVRAGIRGARWTHVIHAAGCHGRLPRERMFQIHVTATQNLLDALSCDPPPFWINIGSAAQYGRQENSTEPRMSERHADAPASAYGASKVEQENVVRANAERGNIAPIFLRVFNAIGPGQAGPFALPYLMAALNEARASNAPSITLDRWDAVRDFIDVRDVARAVVAVIRHPPAAGNRLNVCTGQPTTLIDLARRLASVTQSQITWEPGSSVHDTNEIPWQCGSPSKIFELCHWRPSFALDQTLSDTWAFSNR